MHIAFLLPSFHSASSGGGAESYVSTMADALTERGHRVSIIALAQTEESNGNSRLMKVKSPNLHWYIYRALPFGKSIVMPLREVEWSRAGWSALMQLHRHHQVDVVEAGEIMVLQQMARGEKPPFVVRAHGNQLAIKRFS